MLNDIKLLEDLFTCYILLSKYLNYDCSSKFYVKKCLQNIIVSFNLICEDIERKNKNG